MNEHSRSIGSSRLWVVLLCWCAHFEEARAQSETSSYELYGGYAFLRDQDLETNFPAGWSVSLTKNLSESLGIVGDIGGSYKTEQGVDASVHAFLGGLRWSFRGETVTPYVEGLAGLARASLGVAGLRASESDFAVQGGAGVSIRFARKAALRTGVDFRNIFGDGGSAQEFRILGGLTFGFGGALEGPPPTAAPPRRTPETRTPVRRPPRTSPSPPPRAPQRQPPRTQPPPREPEPATPTPPPRTRPAPPPQPRVVRPQPAQPPAPKAPATPPSPYDRGQEMMHVGNFTVASDYFRGHLRGLGPGKFTIPVGLFCDVDNVSQTVSKARDSEQLFLIHLSRHGRTCYGVYWGLYDSRSEAQRELGALPAALRAPGQAPMPVERILR